MIRNLKVLLAAALALTALGAIAASAHAADEFHCSVNPCRLTLKTDGTGATAHQVFVVENAAKTESASFTCESLRGEAEFSGTVTNDITLGWTVGTTDREAYDNCKINGSPGVVWHMNSCKYTLTGGAGGRTEPGTAEVHILCNAGDVIEMTLPSSTCVFRIGPQTLSGVGYHNVGTSPNREITVTTNLAGIVVTATAGCSVIINPNQTLIGTRTTGNFLITGETPAGVMADAWFE